MSALRKPVNFLAREKMVDAIEAGGSVLVRFPDGRGVHATKVEQLPSEAEFAAASGNPVKVAEVKADLDAEIAKLQKRRTDLDAAEKAKADAALKAKADAEAPPKTPGK